MKSRIKPELKIKARLIGYCINDDKKEQLTAAAGECGIDIDFIGSECAGETLGYIAGVPGSVRTENDIECQQKCPACELLILCGLKSTAVDRLLGTLRRRGVNIELKCVLTPINQNWELSRLIEELEREHKAMHGNTEK